MFTSPENWSQFTPTAKWASRFTSWMALDIPFAGLEVQPAYKQRVQMIKVE